MPQTAAMDTFTASKHDQHPTDLAMLRGARLVTASRRRRAAPGQRPRIKQLTGGDPITARFMRQDFFTFRPQFKLMIVGNHKPVLRNVDDAARRRFNIVPFDHKPATPDPRARGEAQGRMARHPAVDDRRLPRLAAERLVRPASVRERPRPTSRIRTSGAWLEERCEQSVTGKAASSALFRDWKAWAERRNESPGTNKSFSEALERRQPKERTKNGVMFLGLDLKPSDTGAW